MGPGAQYSILDYAESANEIGQQYGYSPITVKVEDCGEDFAICMDCKRLIEQTRWEAKVTKAIMLHNMYKNKTQ